MRVSRGTPSIAPDSSALVILTATTLEFVDSRSGASRSLAIESRERVAAWSDDAAAFATTSLDGRVCVYAVLDSHIVKTCEFSNVHARSCAFAKGNSVLWAMANDGAALALDADGARARELGDSKCKFGAINALARSCAGEYVAILVRDALARDEVRVFSRDASVVSFKPSGVRDAVDIDMTIANGDHVLVFDDSCDVDAVPTLVVHRMDGVRRATIRNVYAGGRARTKRALIVFAPGDGLVWIDQERWVMTRAVRNPIRMRSRGPGSTRVYREVGDAYEALVEYDDARSNAVGGVIAVSPCETVLACACSSRANVLFLWSAVPAFEPVGDVDDDEPLAAFIHDADVVALKWFPDDRVAGGCKLIFLLAEKSAAYVWIPGAVVPVRVNVDHSFVPRALVGEFAGRVVLASPDAFLARDLAFS